MSHVCQSLHQLVHGCRRHSFPFDRELIPTDGIYVLFESGEHGHGDQRIVRVGSHTGTGQLRSRLAQHFTQEKKDRSIFRKNIGRALLSKDNDPFLDPWNLDLTTRRMKDLHADRVDFVRQAEIETEVTSIIRACCSFVVIPISSKPERLRVESRMISTVAWCDECNPSSNWLGRYSPKEKVRRSGLWQVNELYKESLSVEDCERLRLIAEEPAESHSSG